MRARVAAGKPVWADCGGMMALFDAIVDHDGVAHRMWALVPGAVTMQVRLAALGPQQLELTSGTLRGHTYCRPWFPSSPEAAASLFLPQEASC